MELILLAGIASIFLVFLSKIVIPGSSFRRKVVVNDSCCLELAGICTVPVEVGGNECLFKIVEKGLLGGLLVEGNICGLVLINKPIQAKKAIRNLESDIVSLEVLYERYKMDKYKYRIEHLREQLTEILRSNDPIEPNILLLLCPKNDTPIDYLLSSIENKLEPYECKISLACSTRWLRIKPRRNLVTSNKKFTNKLHTQLRQIFTLSRAYMYDAINIGTTLGGGRRVVLPIRGKEGTLHTCIIGPTGRGKTTTIAKIVSRLNSEELDSFIIAIDPKGDLSMYLNQLYGNAFERKTTRDSNLYRELVIINGGKELVAYSLKGSSKDKQEAILRIIENIVESTKVSNSSRVTLLAVDEAWMIPKTKILERLLREGRSRNISVLLASQYPGDLSDIVWSNVGNVIIFGSRSRKYLEHIRRYTGIDEEFLDEISRLEVGEALLRYPWSSVPIPVKIL